MARPLRIEYAGAVYHVTSRGNAQKPIFRDDKDRDNFLEILKEFANYLNVHYTTVSKALKKVELEN